MKHVTFVHEQVSQKTQFPECDLEFAKKSDLKARRLLKTFTVRRLQSLSFILVRSRLQMPAIFNATWPRLYIPELRNCKKQNVRDLQHQFFCLHQVGFCRLDFCRVVCEVLLWFIATKNNPANHNHGINKQHFTVKNVRNCFQNLSFRASLAIHHCASEKRLTTCEMS